VVKILSKLIKAKKYIKYQEIRREFV